MIDGKSFSYLLISSIGSEYFATMGIPLVAGREFTAADREQAPRVVVVNETFARRYLPGTNPIENAVGKRVSFGKPAGPFWQIVGVAQDGKYFSIGEAARPFIYLPLRQSYSARATLLVRTITANPQTMIAAVRDEVGRLDGNLPVYNVKTMTEHLGLSLFPARIAATLLGGFGLLALAPAAIGIYGVMSYTITQRTREIGIRVALGARPSDVLRLLVRHGVIVTAIGVMIGLAVALALTRVMANLLYGVSATDPVTFGVVALLLAAVALLASYIPARRATKVDPLVALRYE